MQAFTTQDVAQLYGPDNPLEVISRAEKVELLKRVDAATRALDPRIQQVTVSMAGVWERILVASTDGGLAADIRPLVRFNVSVIVEQNGRRERGGHGGGGRTDYRYFLTDDRAMGYAREALRQALVNLEAVPAPAGTMPVVLGSGWSGVLLHEAVGHGLEGDFNRKGSSAYSGRMGEMVASKLCTIVDDGTLAGRRGSLSVDDEGTPTECTTLIENGVLKGYMQDKLNARLMGVARTGNGRRESYAHLPMPRMTNTYMLGGESDPAEIIASVKKGIYCANLGGGQVDITSGKFVFSTSEAYLIEDGKITRPVKGATLIGNGPEAMSKVSMVGNDLSLDRSADTLSGGEAQRIRLASQIGAGLVGVLYILDEPSIGLHQRDNDRLLGTLKHLRDIGNTVIVVEHDEDAIRLADYVVDIGPGAGVHGGHIVAEGTPAEVMAHPDSLTGKYLSGRVKIEVPAKRTPRNKKLTLSLKGARGNNLRNVDLEIPIGLLTCVTGVSGSGKSTLINNTLYPLSATALNGATTLVSDKKSAAYTQKYLQQSANFYAALDHKTRS